MRWDACEPYAQLNTNIQKKCLLKYRKYWKFNREMFNSGSSDLRLSNCEYNVARNCYTKASDEKSL